MKGKHKKFTQNYFFISINKVIFLEVCFLASMVLHVMYMIFLSSITNNCVTRIRYLNRMFWLGKCPLTKQFGKRYFSHTWTYEPHVLIGRCMKQFGGWYFLRYIRIDIICIYIFINFGDLTWAIKSWLPSWVRGSDGHSSAQRPGFESRPAVNLSLY